MVKASGQIERELRALQDKTELMESALDPLYESYLQALGDAGKRQLVMAAYYLCTQAYPDKFLALSWDERNRLQQSLQALSDQIFVQLSEQRKAVKKRSRRPQPDGLAFLHRLLASRMAGAATVNQEGKDSEELGEGLTPLDKRDRSTAELFSAEEENFMPDAEDDSSEEGLDSQSLDNQFLDDHNFDNQAFDISALEVSDESGQFEMLEDPADVDAESGDDSEDEMDFAMEVPAADERLSLDEEEDLLAALEGLARRSMEMRSGSVSSLRTDGDAEANGTAEGSAEGSAEDEPLTPIHLVKQQMLMEKAIRDVFKSISEEANELLQKANVMPSFPRTLLAAATESGGIGEPANAVPNVVRVSVRVMHGEALLDSDEESTEGDSQRGSSRSDSSRSDSGRSNSKRPKTDRSRADDERLDLDRTDRRSRRDMPPSRRRLRRPERGSRRSKEMRSGRMLPLDIVEMEALPELAAISLRLSEVEFTDPTVSAWRSRLRQKLGELKKLGMRYKKTQRSLETAQAEDAWRSSWTVHTSDADS